MNNNGRPRNNKKHPFVKIKRRARLVYLRILRIDDPPERIARGAAIGVLMGILPTFGLGTLLSLAAAFVFRANKAAAVLGSFIMNPLTSPFFWTASVFLGSLITGQDGSAMIGKFNGENLLNGMGSAYLVFMAGNAVISCAFTVASYFVVKKLIVRHRLKKAKKAGGPAA